MTSRRTGGPTVAVLGAPERVPARAGEAREAARGVGGMDRGPASARRREGARDCRPGRCRLRDRSQSPDRPESRRPRPGRQQRAHRRRRRLRGHGVLHPASPWSALLARSRRLRHARRGGGLRPRGQARAAGSRGLDPLRRRLGGLQPERGRHLRAPRPPRDRGGGQRRGLDADRARAGGGAEGRRGCRAAPLGLPPRRRGPGRGRPARRRSLLPGVDPREGEGTRPRGPPRAT